MKGDSAKCRHETTSYAALYMNVPRCALGICIVIKLSPPSLIRQHRRIPSRRQSASRLPSPRRTTNTPFRAISSERERERGRARSGWGCVTPCLPLTDGRTDGQAPRFLTAVITTSCHVQSHSWFWQPQSCRPYRCIFRCHGVLEKGFFIING